MEKKLIDLAPNRIQSINLKRWYFGEKKKKINLYDNQKLAVKSWISNNMKGIFEMATGTGKTFTALGCLQEVRKKEERLITIIACPLNHLLKQWGKNIKEFDIEDEIIFADSSIYNWKNKMMDILYDLKNEVINKLIILTTFATLSSSDFIKMINKIEFNTLLIVDEVHGCGAPKVRIGLLDKYLYRLGLSATPKRWFDIEGTEELFNYFGDTVYEFPLKKAITTINPATGETYLVPYEYMPYFVELTEDELERYEEQTKKIAQNYFRVKDKKKKLEYYTLLLTKRQQIIKDASNKFIAFEEILEDISQINHCLVYCSFNQIGKVQDILNSYKSQNIIQHKFTGIEGKKPEDRFNGLSEREYLLEQFARGIYQVLVAMKCFDEGVDVPSTKIAIILSSSGNPKQYIQRRGRVLRRYPKKEKATIYDVIVLPTLIKISNPILSEIEKRIIEKELKRYKEFASIALNAVDCYEKIEVVEKKYNIFI